MGHISTGSTEGVISWLRTRKGIVVTGFALVLAFYVLREHWGHAVSDLSYGILLLCPLMHLFMRHGHGGAALDASRSPTV